MLVSTTQKLRKEKISEETYIFDIQLIITIMEILKKENRYLENYGKELDERIENIKLKQIEAQEKTKQMQEKTKQMQEQTKQMQEHRIILETELEILRLKIQHKLL